MYKKILKILRKSEQAPKEPRLDDHIAKHPVHDRESHFIFSAENPLYERKLNMDHDQVMQYLNKRGYKTEEIKGKYGKPEKSILVHNPPKFAMKHLQKLAAGLGQESSIVSDGTKHEFHYHHGDKAGKFHKGHGTIFHDKEPEDMYSTLKDGTHFQHNIDFDNAYDAKESSYPGRNVNNLAKSEGDNEKSSGKPPYIPSASSHPLENASEQTKLIHFSPVEGLKKIDPNYHGVRKIGKEAQQGQPKHAQSFFYLEGVQPEEIVTSGSKSKYVASLGNKKLYDLNKDVHGLREKAKEAAQAKSDAYAQSKGWSGKMMANEEDVRDMYHQHIKDAGYSGFYNSGFGPGHVMSHAVAMFEPITPDSEHKIHFKDTLETSAIDHHAEDGKRSEARAFAAENGHHSPRFLHNLSNSMDKK